MSQISLSIGERLEVSSCDQCIPSVIGVYFKIQFILSKDFQILELLGKGGFACVYRAKCLKSGFEVALKMVSDLFSQNL